MIDRDVRISLLHVIDILQIRGYWLSVFEIIDYLEAQMFRRYDRRSIYRHLDALQEFGQIETKYTTHNTRFTRWRDDRSFERRNETTFANDADFRKAL